MKKYRICAGAICLLLCLSALTSCFGIGDVPEESSGLSAFDQVAAYQGKDPWEQKETKPETEKIDPAETEKETETDPVSPKETEPTAPPETEPETEPVKEQETEPVEENETEPLTEEETETEPLPDDPEELPPISSCDVLPASGTLSSAQSEYLILNAEYSVTEFVDGTQSVAITLYLSTYEIYVGAHENSGTLTVCGETVSFSNPEISNTARSVHTYPLYSGTFRAEKGQPITVSASWTFNGVYGGTRIDDLTLQSCFVLEP